MSLSLWIRAVRAPFFTAAIVPVILGTAVAFYDSGSFNPIYFLLTLISMIFIHAGINLANDYFDHKSGSDEANTNPTPFSGGSRMIQTGALQANTILSASVVSFAAGSLIGIYLFTLLGQTILLLGVAGVFIGFFYTAPPFKLGYRGLGELMVGLGFGTLIVAGSYYVQAGAFAMTAIAASVPVAILIAMVLFINEFPDHDADKKTRKNTLVVLLGKKTAVKLYQFLIAAAYLWIIAMVFAKIFPITALITLLTIPLAMQAIKTSAAYYDKINELLPANASTIKLHLSLGLLMALGYMLASYLSI